MGNFNWRECSIFCAKSFQARGLTLKGFENLIAKAPDRIRPLLNPIDHIRSCKDCHFDPRYAMGKDLRTASLSICLVLNIRPQDTTVFQPHVQSIMLSTTSNEDLQGGRHTRGSP